MTTPSQTVGPFFHIALQHVASDGPIRISGHVLDGAGEPVPDALVETWQVDGDFRGFARCPTDEDGRWQVRTHRTPFVDVSVFARGLLNRVVTRIYFEDDPDDPVLAAAGERRRTLLARPAGDGEYRFDVILQGEGETVFFNL
jgi:protocatechuate 3,4-dioxygenase alpha subunit